VVLRLSPLSVSWVARSARLYENPLFSDELPGRSFLFGARRRCSETGRMESAKLIELLRGSRQMLLFTGAGISTGSGIPDFRGPEGVWKRRQPVYYHDFMRSEAARVEHWDFKLEGWPAFKAARPNATHEAVVLLERAGKVRAVVTQNIDGLHARAGTSAERLVELHGTNTLVECQACGATEHDDLPEVTLRLEGDVGDIFPSAVAAALSP
jgi:hypothetical protein